MKSPKTFLSWNVNGLRAVLKKGFNEIIRCKDICVISCGYLIHKVVDLYSRNPKIDFGIIDFLSVVPSFLELFIPGVHYLTVLRILRVLRVFRVLKLVKYMVEATIITTALNKSRR